MIEVIQTTLKNYLLEVLFEPIIRSRARKLKDTFNGFIQNIYTKINFKEATSYIHVVYRLVLEQNSKIRLYFFIF